MKIDKKILGWLTTVPAHDSNFRWNIKFANIETLKKALKDKTISKSARSIMKSRLRRIDK